MAAAAMKHMASNFAKLDKFEGVDFRRWQKKMHFLLFSMSVVYVLTTPMPEDGGDNLTVKQVRKRAKWDNDNYVCRGLILNVMKQYNELLCILRRFTYHKMNMDEAIQVSCIIDKLLHSWKDFKHTLKHLKEELTLVELGSHLRIKESLKVQDSDKPKGNNVVGPSVVNMAEHNNSSRYNDNKGKHKHHDNTIVDPNKKPKVACWKCGKPAHLKKDCKAGNVGNKANGSGTKGSVNGLSNSMKASSLQVKIGDPNITMEEYIRLEEEKSQRHGRTFNWQTATFEKVKYYEDEDDCFTDFKTEFPAIVFDNSLTPDTTPSCEPTVSPPNENKIDFKISLDESDDEDYTVEGYTKEIVHDFEQRLETIFDRQVNRVHILDFEGLNLEMRQDLAVRLRMVYTGDDGQLVFARDLRDYWTEILSGKDFLGPTPSYVFIQDPVRRLCQRMIAYSISGRGQALEKGQAIRRSLHWASGFSFGLVSDEGLRGLQVVARELLLIDLRELGRLNICLRFDDTWDWVASGPERQQATAVGDQDADEAGSTANEIEEEMRDLGQSVVGLRGVVESSITEQTRVSTWMISCLTQLMDASRRTYQPFDSTLLGSSGIPYQKRVRPRTGDSSTSAAPHTDDQPDP
uniref:CCHC-type domain-containing protein n=1 Tax=Tanacetum cinerariifolium TaxID=118510 RepID=A0A6L2KXB3_TANCI|nr:hypothetical protein [Tanacetum cinerariifolium]